MASSHKDELVLAEFRVVRITGKIKKEGEKFFWEYETSEGEYGYCSCIDQWISLRGAIKFKEYEKLKTSWNNSQEHDIKVI